MSDALNIQNIQALYDLKNSLSRFSSGTQEGLHAVEAEITRTQKWVEERVQHWSRETERAKRDMNEASRDLRRCEASGYRDKEGYYHQPDCGNEIQAVRRAEDRLGECEKNLEIAQAGQSRVAQAVSEYQREASRLSQLTVNHTQKAQSFLTRTAAKYEAARVAANSVGEIGSSAGTSAFDPATSPPTQTNSMAELPKDITWAEKHSILKKIDGGQSITVDEFKRLQLPISDLQSGTLVEDTRWIQDLLEGQKYMNAMRDSQEAQNLKDAILATLEAINYWRSK